MRGNAISLNGMGEIDETASDGGMCNGGDICLHLFTIESERHCQQ